MATHDVDKIWDGLVDLTAEALRMNTEEKAKFAASPVAKLVGLLPFLASCEEAERTGLAHLATWVVANRGKARQVFDHKKADDRDPLARLAPIADFRGGDKAVIEAGMRRLALCMVAGYKRDMESGKDLATGEYNPLIAKAWDYDKVAAGLGSASAGTKAAETSGGGVDAVLGADEAFRGYWLPE